MGTRDDLLDSLDVPFGCTEDWEQMTPAERARRCARCDRLVHDLGQLSRAEIAELLERTGGDVCVALERRDDGSLVTADPPRRTLSSAALALGGALALAGCEGQPVTREPTPIVAPAAPASAPVPAAPQAAAPEGPPQPKPQPIPEIDERRKAEVESREFVRPRRVGRMQTIQVIKSPEAKPPARPEATKKSK